MKWLFLPTKITFDGLKNCNTMVYESRESPPPLSGTTWLRKTWLFCQDTCHSCDKQEKTGGTLIVSWMLILCYSYPGRNNDRLISAALVNCILTCRSTWEHDYLLVLNQIRLNAHPCVYVSYQILFIHVTFSQCSFDLINGVTLAPSRPEILIPSMPYLKSK